jgi:FXSXX-COOH protein
MSLATSLSDEYFRSDKKEDRPSLTDLANSDLDALMASLQNVLPGAQGVDVAAFNSSI